MRLSIVSAVNDDGVLSSCLLQSPVANSAEVIARRGYANAATAYNSGLDAATGDIVAFVHQDAYLPPGWLGELTRAIDQLARSDPDWGVLGICGFTAGGELRAWVYSSGLGRVLGGPFEAPATVRTLDEVLLVIRRNSGLRFDESLPGFHMYGTDICLAAEQRGMSNYVVPCFVFHNSNGIRNLPWAFWQACWHVRQKWSRVLPIRSPCTTVSRWPFGTLWQMVQRWISYNVRGHGVGRRSKDPVAECSRLLTSGSVPSSSKQRSA